MEGVIANVGTPPPTGTVQFLFGGTVIGSAPVASNGTANYNPSTANVPPGTYNITARYLGDANYGPATAPGYLPYTISPKQSTKLTLSPASQTLGIGTAATLQVTAVGNGSYAQPTGSIAFSFAGTTFATAKLTARSSSSTAALSASTKGLAPGTYKVTATYAGDTFNAAAAPVSATVILTEDSVTVSASPNPAPANSSVTLTATVTSTKGTPTGSVIFYASSTDLGSNALNGSGTASIVLPSGTLAAGSYQITAYYAGDANNPQQTSPAITLTVQ
jgi:hypothetical protein